MVVMTDLGGREIGLDDERVDAKATFDVGGRLLEEILATRDEDDGEAEVGEAGRKLTPEARGGPGDEDPLLGLLHLADGDARACERPSAKEERGDAPVDCE